MKVKKPRDAVTSGAVTDKESVDMASKPYNRMIARTCLQCHEFKQVKDFHVSGYGIARGGPTICTDCRKRLRSNGQFECSGCKLTKPGRNFNLAAKNIITQPCKQCRREKNLANTKHRQEIEGRKPFHRINNATVDKVLEIGECDQCGTTEVYKAKSWWKCGTKTNEDKIKKRPSGNTQPVVKGRQKNYEHRITEVNKETFLGLCSQCGPDMRVYPVGGVARKSSYVCLFVLMRRRFRRYNYNNETLLELAVAGKVACHICGLIPSDPAAIAIDHDHFTGFVRGLLCKHCNSGLGHFKDDPSAMRRAAQYLEDSRLKDPFYVDRNEVVQQGG